MTGVCEREEGDGGWGSFRKRENTKGRKKKSQKNVKVEGSVGSSAGAAEADTQLLCHYCGDKKYTSDRWRRACRAASARETAFGHEPVGWAGGAPRAIPAPPSIPAPSRPRTSPRPACRPAGPAGEEAEAALGSGRRAPRTDSAGTRPGDGRAGLRGRLGGHGGAEPAVSALGLQGSPELHQPRDLGPTPPAGRCPFAAPYRDARKTARVPTNLCLRDHLTTRPMDFKNTSNRGGNNGSLRWLPVRSRPICADGAGWEGQPVRSLRQVWKEQPSVMPKMVGHWNQNLSLPVPRSCIL